MPEAGRLALGIDPGLASCGIGVVRERDRNYTAVHWECLRTKPGTALPDRLAILHRAVKAILKKYGPSTVSMERLFFSNNAKTAMDVGKAQGAILLAFAGSGLGVSEYTPVQVKQAVTGDGRADKRAVGEMVKRLLRMDMIPTPDDAADALAIAYTHLVSTRGRA